jgi:hypothetical protein
MQIARILNRMYMAFGNKVYKVVQSECPNLTCCPVCRIDDFCHCVDDDDKEKCEIRRYSFADLEYAAEHAGANDWQTKMKDIARGQAQEWLAKHGYLSKEADGADEISEEDVSELCEQLGFRFDSDGNQVFPE